MLELKQAIDDYVVGKISEIDLKSILATIEHKQNLQKNTDYNVFYLDKGIHRAIHIAPTVMRQSIAQGIADPFIVIREKNSDYERVLICRKIEILGLCQLGPNLSNPLPFTNGNGVAYIETDAEIAVFYNKNESQPEFENAFDLEEKYVCGILYRNRIAARGY